MEKEIKLKWVFKTSPEKVWDYLTQPELLSQWLMYSDFKPILGHKFQFYKEAKLDCIYGGMVFCEIVEIKTAQLLSYTWEFDIENGKPQYHSLVTWHLSPIEEGTELTLIHSGFTHKTQRDNHEDGWIILLENLGNRIAIQKNETSPV